MSADGPDPSRCGASDRRAPRPAALALAGEYDERARPRLARQLAELNGNAAISLRGVSYLDSSALGEFARYAKRVAPARPLLLDAPPHIRRVLEIMGFDRLFVVDRRRGRRRQ